MGTKWKKCASDATFCKEVMADWSIFEADADQTLCGFALWSTKAFCLNYFYRTIEQKARASCGSYAFFHFNSVWVCMFVCVYVYLLGWLHLLHHLSGNSGLYHCRWRAGIRNRVTWMDGALWRKRETKKEWGGREQKAGSSKIREIWQASIQG